MKAKTFTPMGALHPALFFAGVYIVALLFSIFICSAIFNSCNSTAVDIVKKESKSTQPVPASQNSNTVAALR
ncbi:MAG: hypothetical protein JWM28_201 [Chitinophagaceae bacterium]|nr:hypothetical protein [Chitinophagaceae bacterium]